MRLNEDERKLQHIIQQIRERSEPSVSLVHRLLQSLLIFHIYDLERALTSLNARVRDAALKKIEQYLSTLTSDDAQERKKGIVALEQYYEPMKMLDEDA